MNKNTWEQNRSPRLTIEDLKAVYGEVQPGHRPTSATRKGFHHKVGEPFRPLPGSTRKFKKNHMAHRLIQAIQSRPVKKHQPNGSVRVDCAYKCGNEVQPPQVICRSCQRKGRRAAAKADYKQRKAERT